MAGENLAETYILIHTFLSSREHTKAAKAVKKAAKESKVVNIKSGIAPTINTSLEKIVLEWKELSTRVTELETSIEQLNGEIRDLKATHPADKRPRSPSVSSSSSSDSEQSESSDSSSSSSGPKNKAAGLKSLQNGHSTGVVDTIKSKPTSLSDESSSTSGSDSDEEVARASFAATTNTQTRTIPDNSGSHINGNKSLPKEQVNEPDVVGVEKVVKRQRTEDGDKTTQTEALTVKKEVSQVKVSNKGKQRGGVPFQRIKGDKVAFADERLKDNTFAARGGTMDDYGAKASADLIVTRGSGFRKEKNKKKRGSYRGGEITLQSHSIKFE